MTPGTLFFDSSFAFHDGEIGKKIFVVLGTSSGITIVAKTTSNGKNYLNDFGCQENHRFPNFHLVQNCCCLSKPTWVCLDEFYELKDTDLLQRHFNGQVNRIGELPKEITIKLLTCTLNSQDISYKQSDITKDALQFYLQTEN